MKWPNSVAPFDVALIPSLQKNDKSNYLKAEKIYSVLTKNNIDALFDDTEEHLSAKFKKFDLIGIPYQIILGSKTPDDAVEFREVGEESQIIKIDNLQKRLDKVENFTQYFLCNNFHDLEINDLKKRLEMRKTSQSGEAAKDPSEGSA